MKTLPNPQRSTGEGQIWPLTVSAYRALGEAGLIPENTELLYGQVYQKMSKSPAHSALVRRLLRLLQRTSLPGRFVMSEQPITSGDSEPEPDIAVVSGVEEDFWQEHPQTADLAIEICITSYEFDRSKLAAYAKAHVKECWLVLGPQKQIEVYRRPSGEHFSERSIHGPGGKLQSAAVPEFTIDLDRFFAK